MAKVTASDVIEGVVVVEPRVFGDDRGLFVETYRHEWLPGTPTMLQANRADRCEGSLVGLHYHLHQADYWYVPAGRALVALHDLRASSPTEGASLTLEIGPDHRGVYIPRGVAHGFYALTDLTITYLVDRYYDPDDELGVAWDDPALGIDWPTTSPVLSERDRRNPRKADIPVELRPR
ncbi:MAG: dTDP-4-dehydrorhamnose 3,5-epimerase [Acidimicrobiia bacterium]|nr:dTDP-4-dehydrorhamnose 3,5-epimerase [Acidimicrobiia bacterium]